MKFYHFFVICAAAWNIASLLVWEEGPFLAFVRLRHFVGVKHSEDGSPYGETEIARLFSCVWCMSRWVALVFVVAYFISPSSTVIVSLPFAVSTIIIMLESNLNG